MRSVVECIPNFSEGRNPAVVSLIREAIASVPTACVPNTHIDADHNRSVITFVAEPEQVVDAAVSAVRKASELIDLRIHHGEHPRLGATDVLPFVPISGVTMDKSLVLAPKAGGGILAGLP